MKITKNSSIWLSLLSATAATAPFFLYAPVSIYLPNAEEFPFTLYSFRWIPLLLFLGSALILFAIGILLQKLLKKMPAVHILWCTLLFTVGLMTYLQGNFLFEDTGIFNGLPYESSEHLEHIRANTALWCATLLIAVVLVFRFRARLAEPLKVFSGLFSAFILLSVFILLLGAKSEYLQPRTTFVSTDGLFDASNEKNVIVIIPDMFDQTYMDTILEESPELTEDLTGFVYYPETVGCFFSTKESVPYFLSQEPLYDRLQADGYSFGIYTDGRFIPQTLQERTINCVSGEIGISDYGTLAALLCRLSACAYAPDLFRESAWLTGTEFDELCVVENSSAALYTNGNLTFYSQMKESGIHDSPVPCFRMIHLYGAHYPYIHDEYLNSIVPSYTDENAVAAAKGSLRIITAYLNRLKAAGAYDSSLIVIMADHGYSAPGLQTDPLFMVKLPSASDNFSISEETVPQETFADKILSMIP